ncbi:MAG: hypothetical protein NTU44_01630 [Bacteroidetes bacterium]|nr:hypothetical protein [Bacteroidota bacterium]
MKTKIFIFLMLLAFSSFAQKKQPDTIPAIIQRSFAKEYPESKVKSWEQKGDNYIANTQIDGQNAQAFFTKTGTWVESVYTVNQKEMPGRINSYLDYNYPGSSVVQALYKENKSNGAFYFLQIKKAKSTQPIDVELYFDVSGTFQTKTEFHPLNEPLSTSSVQEKERNAREEKEKREYQIRREALLKMDRSISEQNLPSKVNDNFKKKFPNAEEVKWDSLDNVYTVHFIDNEIDNKADFSLTADWLTTVESLPPGPVYRPVDDYLEQNYPSFKINVVERITKRDKNNGYYIEVHPKVKKGQKPSITKLYFDKTGKFLKAEEPPKDEVKPDESDEPDVAENEEPDQFDQKLDKEEQKPKKNDNNPTALKITAKELPSGILNYVKENYPEYIISKAYFDDYEELGNAYKVTIRREGVNQKESELYFTDRGKLLREDNPPPKKAVVEKNTVTEQKTTQEEVVEEETPEATEETATEVNESDVPPLVKKNFTKRYPKAVDPVWKEDGKKYIVECYLNEVKNIFEFSADGVIEATRTEMDPKNIFNPIQRYLDDNYAGYKVRYAEKIIRKDRKNYFYVEIYSKKKNANPPELQLYFDKVGKPMENQPD